MYALPSIISLLDVCPQQGVMYQMQNIHDSERAPQETDFNIRRHDVDTNPKIPDVKEQGPFPEFKMLEARQEKILSQLAELKKQVSTLCKFLKQPDKMEEIKQCVSQGSVINLVVNANPKRPPYSILALQKFWKDTNIKVTPYIHSNIEGKVPIIYIDSNRPTGNNIINLSLIWKEVDDIEFVSSIHNYPIVGESNFLRYISRFIATHNYENSNVSIEPHVTDSILDLCYYMHYEQSINKVYETLSVLANKLGRLQWNGKDEPNIADIVLWSTIRQFSLKKIPSNLKKWYAICEKRFFYS